MQGLPQIMRTAAALCLLILASVWDIRQRRIPNAVTLPAIAAGLLLTAVWNTGGLPITIVTLILLFFFGMLRLMGQGDVKLVMAMTSICGPSAALISTGIAAILIVAVQVLLHPGETYSDAKNALKALLAMDFKRIDRKGRNVPFAPYILAGFIYLTVYRLFVL